MLKVINGGARGRVLEFKFKEEWKKESKKCRVCGNTFVAMSRFAESCEFCKSCFHGVVSAGRNAPMLALV